MRDSIRGDLRVTGSFLISVAKAVVALLEDAGMHPSVAIEIEGKRGEAVIRRRDCTLDDLVSGFETDVSEVAVYVTAPSANMTTTASVVVRPSDPPFLYVQGDDMLAAEAMSMLRDAFASLADAPADELPHDVPSPRPVSAPRAIPVPALAGAWLLLGAIAFGVAVHPSAAAVLAASAAHAALLAVACGFLRVAPETGPGNRPKDDLASLRRPTIGIDLGPPGAAIVNQS